MRTFEQWYDDSLAESEDCYTLQKNKEHYRDYWKEVQQEFLLTYYGGRYKSPEFFVANDVESISCERAAKLYIAKGLNML